MHEQHYLSYPGWRDQEDVFIASSRAPQAIEALQEIYSHTLSPEDYKSEWEALGFVEGRRLLRRIDNPKCLVTIEGEGDVALAQPLPGAHHPYLDQDDLIKGWIWGGWSLSGKLWRDQEFVLAAMTANGWACYEAHHTLWDDPWFCLSAVQVNGLALAQVSGDILSRPLCLAALCDDSAAAEYVPRRYWRSITFCASALAGTPNADLIRAYIPRWIQALLAASTHPSTDSGDVEADWYATARKLRARYGRRSRI